MARHEVDKEDLLREATALVERVELSPREAADHGHITAGFRRDGGLSIFFGGDPVYHFNAAGELRRAYCDGRLYKAERGRLVSLSRTREPNEVQLVRHDLTDDEQAAFISRMQSLLSELARSLETNACDVVGQAPPECNVLGRLAEWLAGRATVHVAAFPHAGRK